jgi:hypothetical protein
MESQGKEGAMAIESEHPELRELDHRSGDGFDVTVEDTRTNDAFRIAVDPRDALEAFHHPYAYGCRRGRPMTVAGERRAAAESHEG